VWSFAAPESLRARAGAPERHSSWRPTRIFFADAQRKGYGVVEFRPGQLSTTLRVVDDVTRLNTKIETLARFTVQAGRPVVERL
jgi:alkaline phosphatase D